MPTYLTIADVEARIENLKTGELPDNFVLDRDSPRDFYGMYPELLCKHGIRRGLCYPCTPLPAEDPNRLVGYYVARYLQPLWGRRDSRYDYQEGGTMQTIDLEPIGVRSNQRCMWVIFPVGGIHNRKEPCNYYQRFPLYYDRAAYRRTNTTPVEWWASVKKFLRSEPKARIII